MKFKCSYGHYRSLAYSMGVKVMYILQNHAWHERNYVVSI